MTIKSKTIRYEVEAKKEEFNKVKYLLSFINGEYESYVNDYVVAYVLLKNNGYNAEKINDVIIDQETKNVSIEFESKVQDHD